MYTIYSDPAQLLTRAAHDLDHHLSDLGADGTPDVCNLGIGNCLGLGIDRVVNTKSPGYSLLSFLHACTGVSLCVYYSLFFVFGFCACVLEKNRLENKRLWKSRGW